MATNDFFSLPAAKGCPVEFDCKDSLFVLFESYMFS